MHNVTLAQLDTTTTNNRSLRKGKRGIELCGGVSFQVTTIELDFKVS
jgi:hypothetical protein